MGSSGPGAWRWVSGPSSTSGARPIPLVDLSLLRIPTFEACIWGGSIFRVAAGALPFLLPLLLQVGFGMSAFASGLLTCGSALGSFLMKLTTGPILRRFGFRRVLIGNTIISAGSLLVCAFFSVSTPVVLVFLLLLGGGFFRSLQYTCLNTLAYADIEPDKMSAATSFSSMMQQLSNGMGVAVGAILLHAMLSLRGASPAELGVGDVHRTFVAVAVLCLFCLPFFLRLLPRAGAEVSGHRRALTPTRGAGAPALGRLRSSASQPRRRSHPSGLMAPGPATNKAR